MDVTMLGLAIGLSHNFCPVFSGYVPINSSTLRLHAHFSG